MKIIAGLCISSVFKYYACMQMILKDAIEVSIQVHEA